MPTINGKRVTGCYCGSGQIMEIKGPDENKNNQIENKNNNNSWFKDLGILVLSSAIISGILYSIKPNNENLSTKDNNTTKKTLPQTVAEKYYIKNILKGCGGIKIITNPACSDELEKTGKELK